MAQREEDRLCSAAASGAAVGLLASCSAGLWPAGMALGPRPPSCKCVISYTSTNATILYQAQGPRLCFPGKTPLSASLWENRQLNLSSCQFGVWITLPRSRLARQLAPASSVGRLILLTVRELALASLGCQSGKKQLWVVWHF